MNIIKLLLQYLFGFYLVLTSIIFFSIGGTSKSGALISMVCALIVLPLTRGFIEKSFNFKFATPVKYLILIFGFFAPMFFINSDKTAEQKTLAALPGFSDSLSFDTDTLATGGQENRATSHSKNILPFAGNIRSKNKLADSKNSAKKKFVNSKSTSKSNYAGSSKTYKTNKRKRAVSSRNSSSYQSSSGYCGHANKTGGNCRRRVKGGGYCWQHS